MIMVLDLVILKFFYVVIFYQLGEKKMLKKFTEQILMFIMLLAFWLILSPAITIEAIITGSIAVAFVVAFSRDLILTKDESPLYSIKKIFLLLSYIPVLVLEIIKSGIDVAKIVLNPKMPISPGFTKIKVPLQMDFTKVLFANSVTLTPGTLTVDIIGDEYIIHHLTDEASKGLVGSTLENYARKLEE